MQDFLNNWLLINCGLSVLCLLVLVFHLTFNAGKGDEVIECKSLVVVDSVFSSVALSWVLMSLVILCSGIMPALKTVT
jgi:hypothetical protein